MICFLDIVTIGLLGNPFIFSPLPDSTHASYSLTLHSASVPSVPLCSHPARKNQGSQSPMPRRASASAVWFTRSEHAFGIFLTRCFLKSPDQSDLSLTALRHLRCLIELSETREKSTVCWIALVIDCCCFNHCALLGVGYWCSVGDCLLCVFVVCVLSW